MGAPTNSNLYTASSMVNYQLVPQVRSNYFFPSAVGPVVQGVPASPPQSPPGYGAGVSNAAASAASNPWSFTKSPVPWLLVFALVGFLLLRYVHHGY